MPGVKKPQESPFDDALSTTTRRCRRQRLRVFRFISKELGVAADNAARCRRQRVQFFVLFSKERRVVTDSALCQQHWELFRFTFLARALTWRLAGFGTVLYMHHFSRSALFNITVPSVISQKTLCPPQYLCQITSYLF